MSSLDRRLAELWRPTEKLTALQWAERNIVLDKRFTMRPGPYDVTYTPYLARLHDWFSDPAIRQITLAKGAQLGGTTWLANLIQYVIAENPGPVLYVTSTNENAKSWSERELLPRLKLCKAIKPLMPVDHDDFRKCEMHFQSCTVKLVGSNSEGNLASRPVRFLFADEVDKWPPESGKEAPAIELAKARTNAFRAISKIVMISTPSIEKGQIWLHYLQGSQHRFFVRCPDCGEWQFKEFEQIRWPESLRDLVGEWDLDGVEREAWYQCKKCESHWPAMMKDALVRGGEWHATNPKAPAEHRSAQISALYSPAISWGQVAKIFLQKKNTTGGLHDFHNSILGIPFRERGAEVDETHVAARRADYRLGEVPDKAVALFLGSDVQQAFTNYVVRAFARDGESWLIDYGRFAGLDDLVQWASSAEWNGRKLTAGIVDSGFATEHVYRACMDAARKNLRLFPSKGSGEKFLSKPVRMSDITVSSRTLRKSLIIYSDVEFKRKLYIDALRDGKTPWWIPASAGDDYVDELLRERLITIENKRGYEEFVWKRFGANHYADAEKLTMVLWAMQ
jgi:phage terminase large subunit GpA-like protein